ncbi:hypothetical protein SDC9_206871 [bioreactor metagenome]|uniref:Uncharacterized protein n=1 Tax=bioreactor metagenome TaxID=1076179 RepID=A0A645J6A1_9ZZZZ
METTGNFVGIFVEFSSGTDFGHDHFQCGFLLFFVKIYRNSSAVVTHGNSVSLMDSYIDGVAMSSERLVNRIIHYFINQMVKTSGSHITDVHRWS